jgi:hypothetical protein
VLLLLGSNVVKSDPVNTHLEYSIDQSCFGMTYTKVRTTQRRLAWPQRKDDTQNLETVHTKKNILFTKVQSKYLKHPVDRKEGIDDLG